MNWSYSEFFRLKIFPVKIVRYIFSRRIGRKRGRKVKKKGLIGRNGTRTTTKSPTKATSPSKVTRKKERKKKRKWR